MSDHDHRKMNAKDFIHSDDLRFDNAMQCPVCYQLVDIDERHPAHRACLDHRGEDSCRGIVEYHSIDPGRQRAHPRCGKHWNERVDRRNDPNSMEMYADSDVAPSWFDPAAAGERWNDEY